MVQFSSNFRIFYRSYFITYACIWISLRLQDQRLFPRFPPFRCGQLAIRNLLYDGDNRNLLVSLGHSHDSRNSHKTKVRCVWILYRRNCWYVDIGNRALHWRLIKSSKDLRTCDYLKRFLEIRLPLLGILCRELFGRGFGGGPLVFCVCGLEW